MPVPLDHIAESLCRILQRSNADGVEVLLPRPWKPADPFASRPDTPS